MQYLVVFSKFTKQYLALNRECLVDANFAANVRWQNYGISGARLLLSNARNAANPVCECSLWTVFLLYEHDYNNTIVITDCNWTWKLENFVRSEMTGVQGKFKAKEAKS